MKVKENNYAFIDSQNVNLAIRDQEWILDWKKFRVYLTEKYGVSKAFIFIGYLQKNQPLYNFLQSTGFVLVFKPTVENHVGVVKGNVDAELVLQTMIEFEKYDRAVIVSGDGDFYCLINYLQQKNKLKIVLVPNQRKYSKLLKPFNTATHFLNYVKNKIEYTKGRH